MSSWYSLSFSAIPPNNYSVNYYFSVENGLVTGVYRYDNIGVNILAPQTLFGNNSGSDNVFTVGTLSFSISNGTNINDPILYNNIVAGFPSATNFFNLYSTTGTTGKAGIYYWNNTGINGGFLITRATVTAFTSPNISTIASPPILTSSAPCFLKGTKILRLDPDTDIESYVPVELLRPGDLILTSQNGHKAVFHIGKKILPRPSDDPDKRNRLYRFPKSISSGMADLYITGEHCILHKSISDELKERVRNHMGDVYITENQYRVPACIDDRAEPYTDNAPVTIWHFALENHSIYRNYGVYANGILVESCSIQYLTEMSNMELL